MKATFINVWAIFWGARTAREKALLGWGGSALALFIAYSVLWSPAQEGRAHLRETLPAMQQTLATMTAQAGEAQSLNASIRGVAPTGGALKDALTASLTEHGINAAQVQMAGNAVQIQLKNAPFPEWTMWLNDMRKQYKVQVSEAHITALPKDGQVDLNVSLEPAVSR